jgi:hypothetical protein
METTPKPAAAYVSCTSRCDVLLCLCTPMQGPVLQIADGLTAVGGHTGVRLVKEAAVALWAQSSLIRGIKVHQNKYTCLQITP